MTQFSLLRSWKTLQNPPQDLELHQHPLQEGVVLFHPQIVWAELHAVSLKGADDLHQRGLRRRVAFLHLLCLSMDSSGESVCCQRCLNLRVVKVDHGSLVCDHIHLLNMR